MNCYERLALVEKPYQYVGHEENSYKKSFSDAKLRIVVAFPDSYEIGMSNTGVQIIYHIINEKDECMADRVYAPLTDFGKILLEKDQPLRSREHLLPLSDFDCIAFSLQHELCYTNVLYMLDIAKIPLLASERGDLHPLVIAGGQATTNPEPTADFFDLFVVGEGEEATEELCDVLLTAKQKKLSKKETLKKLSELEGIYVPSIHKPPHRVKRRIVKDITSAKFPDKPIIPSIKPIHSRISVEVQRGCTRGCRFCQAGYICRPRRERSPEKIIDIFEESTKNTGITEIGLLSLSSADYSNLHEVMENLISKYKREHLRISLPSTRLEALKDDYLDLMKNERRAGITLAPEAGSQRLRNVINKNFTEEEIVETARRVFGHGWNKIKMYFMIGLPTETDEDILAIAELANTIYRKTTDVKGRKNITISISNFIPKPHTPFQWCKQDSTEEFSRKQMLIRSNIRFRSNITFKRHDADISHVEGVLSRGSRATSQLVLNAYKDGAVYDSWHDHFKIETWTSALKKIKDETGIDLYEDSIRARDLDENLPWNIIDCGVTQKYLKKEYQKALEASATLDCSTEECHTCGCCTKRNEIKPVVFDKAAIKPTSDQQYGHILPEGDERRFRFKYKKTGPGIYITTLELQKIFRRAFTRAGMYITFNKGMTPRPKLSMGPALPIGVSSECELFDLSLETLLPTEKIVDKANKFLPNHVQLLTAQPIDIKFPKITSMTKHFHYTLLTSELNLPLQTIIDRIDEIISLKELVITKTRQKSNGKTKTTSTDLKAHIESIKVVDDSIAFTLSADNGQSISPYLIVGAILRNESIENRLIQIHKLNFS